MLGFKAVFNRPANEEKVCADLQARRRGRISNGLRRRLGKDGDAIGPFAAIKQCARCFLNRLRMRFNRQIVWQFSPQRSQPSDHTGKAFASMAKFAYGAQPCHSFCASLRQPACG